MIKKKIYRIGVVFLTIVSLSGLTSCNDWLDVKPKTEEEAASLFATLDGFKSALAGCYIGLCQPELYGRELTYGMVGVLGQEWGKGATLDNSYTAYSYLQNYNYEQSASKVLIDQAWNKMYESVANVNTLIEYTELKKEVLGDYYAVVRGEALAMRAYIHFDLLRLFAPYDFSSEAKPAIPYVKEARPAIAPQLTPAKFVEYALEDVNAAIALLKEDPILTGKDITGMDNGYLANRNFHLNYYAATALLARVQLYAGNTTEALAAAREIIGTAETLPVAPFELVTEVTSADRLFQNELLFGLEMKQMKVVISDYFGEAASKANLNNNTHMLAFSVSAQNNLFAPQNPADDDYRLKIWFKETSSNVANMSNKFEGVEMMPLIRISELYYIAAECLGGKEGLAYLNKIRAYRGLKALTDDSTLQNEIYKEYCKEFLNEGQMFYYYKRKYLSQLGVFKSKAIDPEAVYMLPLPVDEQDYGNKN